MKKVLTLLWSFVFSICVCCAQEEVSFPQEKLSLWEELNTTWGWVFQSVLGLGALAVFIYIVVCVMKHIRKEKQIKDAKKAEEAKKIEGAKTLVAAKKKVGWGRIATIIGATAVLILGLYNFGADRGWFGDGGSNYNYGNSGYDNSSTSSPNNKPSYSSWQECVSVSINPRQAMGQEVHITNICSHTIKRVTVTLYADGRTKDVSAYNLAPGEKDFNLLTIAADAYLSIVDVKVSF